MNMHGRNSSISSLKELLQVCGTPLAFMLLKKELKGILSENDIAYTLIEMGQLCMRCLGKGNLEDASHCPCCMGDPMPFLMQRVHRYQQILPAAQSILSRILF